MFLLFLEYSGEQFHGKLSVPFVKYIMLFITVYSFCQTLICNYKNTLPE